MNHSDQLANCVGNILLAFADWPIDRQARAIATLGAIIDDSNNSISNKRKRRNIIVVSGKPGDSDRTKKECFAIDEGDHHVIDQWLGWEDACAEVRADDQERRVYKLDAFGDKRLTELPPSIVDLDKLECLSLKHSWNLHSLPSDFFSLVNLTELDLSYTMIESFPPSIGLLKNLEILNLHRSSNFEELPEEFGDLCSLKYLNLRTTKLKKLPDSFGKLQNLKILNLSNSSVELLPDSIAHLQELEILAADFSKINPLYCPQFLPNLITKPSEAFWNHPNLKVLNLNETGIELLPEYVGKLKSLKCLFIGEKHPECFGSKFEFLLELTKRCSSLGSIMIHYGRRRPDWYTAEEGCQLASALASNRARYRTKVEKVSPQLWPLVLCNPRRVFAKYFFSFETYDHSLERLEIFFAPYDHSLVRLENYLPYMRDGRLLQPHNDSIYQLLRCNYEEIIIEKTRRGVN